MEESRGSDEVVSENTKRYKTLWPLLRGTNDRSMPPRSRLQPLCRKENITPSILRPNLRSPHVRAELLDNAKDFRQINHHHYDKDFGDHNYNHDFRDHDYGHGRNGYYDRGYHRACNCSCHCRDDEERHNSCEEGLKYDEEVHGYQEKIHEQNERQYNRVRRYGHNEEMRNHGEEVDDYGWRRHERNYQEKFTHDEGKCTYNEGTYNYRQRSFGMEDECSDYEKRSRSFEKWPKYESKRYKNNTPSTIPTTWTATIRSTAPATQTIQTPQYSGHKLTPPPTRR